MTPEEKKQYNRQWYQAHKEQSKNYNKAYYLCNKEKIKRQHLDYYDAHKEAYSAWGRDYYVRNRERVLARVKNYDAQRRLNRWYDKVRLNVQRGASIKTLPTEEQERFWAEFFRRIKKVVPSSSLPMKVKREFL